ncbi:MAG: flagellar biosynthesis protein FlhF [Gammaproteobacteria bacterium]|nr:flagellar biosynthesis protein FlhF [Gammaproteobacteria bacterium]
MKIKRFFAEDVRKAINMVRNELGPDAVLLSNRQVKGGIEIVAAIDYDESLWLAETEAEAKNDTKMVEEGVVSSISEAAVSKQQEQSRSNNSKKPAIEWSQEPTLVEMRSELQNLRGMMENQLSSLAWGDFARRNPLHARLLGMFNAMGITTDLAKSIAAEAIAISDQGNDFTYIWRNALGILASQIPVADDDIINNGGIFAMVGATGVGKTTIIAKLAARFALRHGTQHLALVTLDNYRIGAHDQLRTYGRIIGVPVHVASDTASLVQTLKDLSDKRLVLIDTTGMSQRDIRLSEQLSTLYDSSPQIRNYLIMSATTQYSGLDEIARAYRDVELAGSMITKLDESTNLGSAVSIAIKHKLPIAFLGDGQRVPEDIHIARAANLTNRCVTIMKNSGQLPDRESMAEVFGGIAANAHE